MSKRFSFLKHKLLIIAFCPISLVLLLIGMLTQITGEVVLFCGRSIEDAADSLAEWVGSHADE